MKAVILDMDGVIVDSEPGNMYQVLKYARSFRPDIQEKEMYQVVGRTKQDVWIRIADVIGLGRGWEETRADYEKNWKPFHHLPVDYKKIFRKDTINLLKWAKAQGMKTAVASSTEYRKVDQILTDVGIISYLDVVVSGEAFEKSKPDPSIYLKTARLLGVDPSECVALEDSTVGITAAHRAGVVVIALKDDRFGFDRSLADGEIDSLSEFEGCFANLMKKKGEEEWKK